MIDKEDFVNGRDSVKKFLDVLSIIIIVIFVVLIATLLGTFIYFCGWLPVIFMSTFILVGTVLITAFQWAIARQVNK